MRIKYHVARWFLKLLGWRCDLVPPEYGQRYVLIGFPHTTNMDAAYGVAFTFYNELITHPMVKKEWFFWPMTVFFNAIHAVPVERNAKKNMVQQIVDQFALRDQFIPVIFPEGTRSRVQKIKTGFWSIAHKAKVPVVMVFKDDATKTLRILGAENMTGCMRTDLEKIRDIYREAGYEIPMQVNLDEIDEETARLMKKTA